MRQPPFSTPPRLNCYPPHELLPFSSLVRADELTDSLDTAPTITPVLDLDEILTGADQIGRIVSGQSVRLGGYADLVEGVSVDMGEFSADNRNIVEALRTLHEDMETLQEEVGAMQIVLDTGALVGEMTAPLDRELCRRRDWEGRGM